MRDFLITVDEKSQVTLKDDFLGFEGEHNAVSFVATVSSSSPLSGAEYFRFVFDNYMSPPIHIANGKVSFSLPSAVMVPPLVTCQLCGYKKSGSEYLLIAKSELFSARVGPSQTATVEASEKGKDVFEEAISKCEECLSDVRMIFEDCLQTAGEAEKNANKSESYCSYAESFSATTEINMHTVMDLVDEAKEVQAKTKEYAGQAGNVFVAANDVFVTAKQTLDRAESLESEASEIVQTASEAVRVAEDAKNGCITMNANVSNLEMEAEQHANNAASAANSASEDASRVGAMLDLAEQTCERVEEMKLATEGYMLGAEGHYLAAETAKTSAEEARDTVVSKAAEVTDIYDNLTQNYCLIKEIILTDSVISVLVNADNDYKPFNCSEIIIKAIIEQNTETTENANLLFVVPADNNEWANRFGLVGAINTAGKRYAVVHLKIDGGYVFATGSLGTTNSTSGAVYRDAMSGTLGIRVDSLRRFMIQSNVSPHKIPANSKFAIYGKYIGGKK